MATIKIIRGSAWLISRVLKQSDGTALPSGTITGAKCDLLQNGNVKASLQLGAGPFRFNGDQSALILELTSEQTAQLEPAQLTERYSLTVQDPAYVASAGAPTVMLEKTEVEIT